MAQWLDTGKRNLKVAVYLLCVAVVIAFALSNTHTLGSAGRIADDVRAGDERHLVRNEIDRQVEILVFDQARISHWDEAVRALIAHIDWDFVRDEIIEWHWEDSASRPRSSSGPDGNPRLLIFEEDVRAEAEAVKYVDLAADLVALARDAYKTHRQPAGGGFRVAYNPVRSHQRSSCRISVPSTANSP